LVNGMEQAGKGTAVKQLRQWVDPRLLKVEATIGHPPLAYQPIWQAHTKAMPRHGDIMIYFGNWYADLLYNVMHMATVAIQDEDVKKSKRNKSKDKHSKDKCSKNKAIKYSESDKHQTLPIGKWQDYLQQQLVKLQIFERDLAANHTKMLKCWFHVDVDTLQARLKDKEADPQFLYQIDWSDAEILAQFNHVAAALLRQQDDWVIIDGSDKSQAATEFCHEVLQAMQMALASSLPVVDDQVNYEKANEEMTDELVKETTDDNQSNTNENSNNAHQKFAPEKSTIVKFLPVKIPEQLIDIDNPDVDKSDYNKQIAKKQAKLAELLRARKGHHVVFAFEGMDAAGKGGAIKRLSHHSIHVSIKFIILAHQCCMSYSTHICGDFGRVCQMSRLIV